MSDATTEEVTNIENDVITKETDQITEAFTEVPNQIDGQPTSQSTKVQPGNDAEKQEPVENGESKPIDDIFLRCVMF